jgi:DnaJ-class molecular chaperone
MSELVLLIIAISLVILRINTVTLVCPVCRGTGDKTISTIRTHDTKESGTILCNNCNGRGTITIWKH